MSETKRLIYWDTGIFIAWFDTEEREPVEIQAIRQQIKLHNEGQIVICSSIITMLEILPSRIGYTKYKVFENFTNRPPLKLFNVDKTISIVARDVRDYYSHRKEALDTTLTSTDAIHLATAISKKCEGFYTFDQKDKVGKSKGLLPLSGTIAGKHYLKIARPGYD